MCVSLRWSAAVVVAVLAGAGAAGAEDAPPGTKTRLSFGGGLTVAAPTGEFARSVDVAGGLSGHALLGRPSGVVALRLDGGWLLYGQQTLRRPVRGTDGRVLEDVATTDNWIAHLALGPQVMARAGRVRPYANAFAGGSYFATSSELLRPRFDRGARALGNDPFRTTTHYDDFTTLYGGGAGVLIGLGRGRAALDLGVRYVANSPVRFLAPDDPLEGAPRRSAGNLVEFHIGVSGR
jgi:hypothetical protein